MPVLYRAGRVWESAYASPYTGEEIAKQSPSSRNIPGMFQESSKLGWSPGSEDDGVNEVIEVTRGRGGLA